MRTQTQRTTHRYPLRKFLLTIASSSKWGSTIGSKNDLYPLMLTLIQVFHNIDAYRGAKYFSDPMSPGFHGNKPRLGQRSSSCQRRFCIRRLYRYQLDILSLRNGRLEMTLMRAMALPSSKIVVTERMNEISAAA
jgi:hypothetical protein